MRRATTAAGAALLLAGAVGAAPASAQMAGVPTAPRASRAAAAAEPSPDAATPAERASAKSEEAERQRLDIQAWVDSAAGALSRSAPAPIPPPGAGRRASIFAEPAVPDSLRPPRARAPERRRPRP